MVPFTEPVHRGPWAGSARRCVAYQRPQAIQANLEAFGNLIIR